MSMLEELIEVLKNIQIPIQTGVFEDPAPDEYLVLTPIIEQFGVFADDIPQNETSEIRISIFTKKNYVKLKNQIVKTLIENDFTVTERRYIEHEDDTGYFHFAIDVLKEYEF